MRKSRPSLIKPFLTLVGFMSLILFVSSIDGHRLPDMNKYSVDKIAHFAEYLVLAYLAMRTISVFFPRMGIVKVLSLTLCAVVLFAASDEWRQVLVPNRACDMFDFISDCFGASMGILIFSYREDERAVSVKNTRRLYYDKVN